MENIILLIPYVAIVALVLLIVLMWIIFPIFVYVILSNIRDEIKKMHKHILKSFQYSCDRLAEIENGLTDICDTLSEKT